MTNFDSVMKVHVRHFINNKNTCHYLSPRMQIDLIQKWPGEITGSVVHEAQKMKCFHNIGLHARH
jgi:hypothetical protein